MAPKYKFSYFTVMAIGEPIRLLLTYLGEDFEDNRVTMEDWPKLKPNAPWGKMPLLEFDGKQVGQHLAICRYLGKKAGLSGKDDWEALKIDEIADIINELRTELVKYCFEKDEKRKEELKGPALNETIPYFMKRLDAQVKDNKGFLANGKLSWADLYFAGVCGLLDYMNGSDITANYPNMKALRERVNNLPKIKEWVAKRPKCEM